MTSYPAWVHKDETSDWGISFPDFPGCVTAGRTETEARAQAAELLALVIAGMMEDGDDIPDPTPVSALPDPTPDGYRGLIMVQAPTHRRATLGVAG